MERKSLIGLIITIVIIVGLALALILRIHFVHKRAEQAAFEAFAASGQGGVPVEEFQEALENDMHRITEEYGH